MSEERAKRWIEESQKDEVADHGIPPELFGAQEAFFKRLLAGDRDGCSSLVRELCDTHEAPDLVRLMVVEPSMYDVRTLKETGEIPAEQEELASTIVARIQSELQHKCS